MSLRVRRWSLLVLTVGLVVAAFLPLWLTWHQLPDSLATHWTDLAAPDGWMSRPAFARTMAKLVMVGVGLLLTAVVWLTPEATPHAPLRATGAFLGTLLAGLAASIAAWTVVTQRGLEDTHHLPGPSGLSLALILSLPMALGAVAAFLALGRQVARPEDARASPSLRLAECEEATWWQQLNAPVFWGLALIGLVEILVGLSLDTPSLTMTLSASGLLMVGLGLSMSSIRVSVDKRGVIVRWGPLGWPSTRVPLDDIARASAIHVSALHSGGWGYRGSLRLVGSATIMMRAGPGLRLELRSGKVLTVTVDDPETAAGLLNQLIGRSGPGHVPQTR